jgi:predicted nucleotidyltransferase component of viral defense system
MKSLAPHTHKLFDKVCSLNCIQPFCLVGGTALSIQIENRLSEDLDFMKWSVSKKDKAEVDWVRIEKALESIGNIESRDIWDFDHVEFVVSGVKLSFYHSTKKTPVTKAIHYNQNLFLADIMAIAAMKMEVLLRRSNFRDYYDIYSILQQGYDFKEIVSKAINYSGNLLSTKNLLSMLSDAKRYHIDSGFHLLEPIYDISAIEIENFIKDQIKKYY